MILIDTSAWIEFLRASGDKAVKRRVAACIESDEAAYTCPVLFELLSGAKDREKAPIKEALGLCQRIIFEPRFWERAAGVEQALRKKGVTVPRDDLFVAVLAIEQGISVLCKDKHFDLIRNAGHSLLRIEQFA